MEKAKKRGYLAADHLRAFIERIERLAEDKQAISDDMKAVYAEVKAHGYDPKIVRQIVKIRNSDKASMQEQEAVLGTYLHALGMEDEPEFYSSVRAQMSSSMGRESMLDLWGEMVPPGAEVIVRIGPYPVRLMRTLAGELVTETMVAMPMADAPADDDAPASASPALPRAPKPLTGKAAEADAYEAGLAAGKRDKASRNPYRPEDPLRMHWQRGSRASQGMDPDPVKVPDRPK